jgi:hypothetical protein
MKKRNYGIILVLILLIGVGYAYLSTTLTINGIANFKKNDWSIIWDKNTIYVYPESVEITGEESEEDGGPYFGARLAGQGTANEDPTTIEYRAPLRLPRDVYHFTVDMKNAGSIDAMITENGVRKLMTDLLPEEKKYIEYWVRYTDGNEIRPYDALRAGESRNVEVYIRYRDDLTAADLPEDDNVRTLRSEFDFVQADKTKANFTRVTAGNPTSAVSGADEVEEPIVYGVTMLPNAKITAADGTYTVTVKYTNTSTTKAIKFKDVKTTGLNEAIKLEVKKDDDTELAANTEIAAEGELTVKYIFSLKEPENFVADSEVELNATGVAAAVEINFGE